MEPDFVFTVTTSAPFSRCSLAVSPSFLTTSLSLLASLAVSVTVPVVPIERSAQSSCIFKRPHNLFTIYAASPSFPCAPTLVAPIPGPPHIVASLAASFSYGPQAAYSALSRIPLIFKWDATLTDAIGLISQLAPTEHQPDAAPPTRHDVISRLNKVKYNNNSSHSALALFHDSL